MKLILVKHAMPLIDKTKPAHEWLLSDEGRGQSEMLVDDLIKFDPYRVVTSIEPKAAETGRIIAEGLQLPFETRDGLHEHVRNDTTFYSSADEFRNHVKPMFFQPDEVVFGDESATSCYERFSEAIDTLVEAYPDENIVIVTHGRVMMSYLQVKQNMSADETFDLWKSTKLAEYIVLSLPVKDNSNY